MTIALPSVLFNGYTLELGELAYHTPDWYSQIVATLEQRSDGEYFIRVLVNYHAGANPSVRELSIAEAYPDKRDLAIAYATLYPEQVAALIPRGENPGPVRNSETVDLANGL